MCSVNVLVCFLVERKVYFHPILLLLFENSRFWLATMVNGYKLTVDVFIRDNAFFGFVGYHGTQYNDRPSWSYKMWLCSKQFQLFDVNILLNVYTYQHASYIASPSSSSSSNALKNRQGHNPTRSSNN